MCEYYCTKKSYNVTENMYKPSRRCIFGLKVVGVFYKFTTININFLIILFGGFIFLIDSTVNIHVIKKYIYLLLLSWISSVSVFHFCSQIWAFIKHIHVSITYVYIYDLNFLKKNYLLEFIAVFRNYLIWGVFKSI